MHEWEGDSAHVRARRRVPLLAALAVIALLLARALPTDQPGQLSVHEVDASPSPIAQPVASPIARVGAGTAGAWSALPPAPIGARAGSAAAWTGRELLVWGGNDGSKLADGAAYDPAARTWRVLAAAPVTSRFRQKGVWTGDELVVLHASDGDRVAHAAYDPDADAWRRVSDPPVGHWLWEAALWTGSQVVLLDTASRRVVAYDPDTDSWANLPEVPLIAWAGTTAVSLSGRVVVVGQALDGYRTEVAEYDLGAGSWSAPVAAPVPARRWAPRAAVDPRGGRVLLAGPFYSPPQSGHRALAWQLERGWERLPALPPPLARAPAHLVSSGHQLIVWVGDTPDNGMVLDLDDAAWKRIAPAPLHGRWDAAVVWTGEELLVWGGRGGIRVFGDGASFRLDAARRRVPARPVIARPSDG